MTNGELPWDEVIDRLYRRQEAEFIATDLKSRGFINEETLAEKTDLILRMKEKVEAFRLKP
jgi:hypothetical protein